jgi:hypothetical protein
VLAIVFASLLSTLPAREFVSITTCPAGSVSVDNMGPSGNICLWTYKYAPSGRILEPVEPWDGYQAALIAAAPVRGQGYPNWLGATSRVQAAPLDPGDGQVVYLFPGLLSTTWIFQPVLAYYGGTDSLHFVPGWYIESWRCDSGPHCGPPSTPLLVYSGDVIAGYVYAPFASCHANGICDQWVVITEDVTRGVSTTLDTNAVNPAGVAEVVNRIVSGALEDYGMGGNEQSCRYDLPAGGNLAVTFDDFVVASWDNYGQEIYTTNGASAVLHQLNFVSGDWTVFEPLAGTGYLFCNPVISEVGSAYPATLGPGTVTAYEIGTTP